MPMSALKPPPPPLRVTYTVGEKTAHIEPDPDRHGTYLILDGQGQLLERGFVDVPAALESLFAASLPIYGEPL